MYDIQVRTTGSVAHFVFLASKNKELYLCYISWLCGPFYTNLSRTISRKQSKYLLTLKPLPKFSGAPNLRRWWRSSWRSWSCWSWWWSPSCAPDMSVESANTTSIGEAAGPNQPAWVHAFRSSCWSSPSSPTPPQGQSKSLHQPAPRATPVHLRGRRPCRRLIGCDKGQV